MDTTKTTIHIPSIVKVTPFVVQKYVYFLQAANLLVVLKFDFHNWPDSESVTNPKSTHSKI